MCASARSWFPQNPVSHSDDLPKSVETGFGEPHTTKEQPGTTPPRTAAGRSGNGLAVAALVLGIIGTVFGLLPLTLIIALVCGLVGAGLGPPAIIAATRGRRGRGVMARIGTSPTVLAISLAIPGAAIADDAVTDLDRDLDEIERELERPRGARSAA